jgi:hypothetical protein
MVIFPDLTELCGAFADARVEYLLVGGYAVVLHGRPRYTKDADLWLRDTPENLARASSALAAFGAPDSTIAAITAMAPEDVVWMGRPPTRIDLVRWVPGGDFESAWKSHVERVIDGVTIRVVDRATLIALKEASGRPQDLEDVRALRATSSPPE